MTAADDGAVVERFYAARGNREVIDQVMSPDVIWDITPGFPLGGVYEGLDTVLGTFLAPIGALCASMAARPEALYSGGQGHVIAGGKIRHLHQTADSQVLQALLKEPAS